MSYICGLETRQLIEISRRKAYTEFLKRKIMILAMVPTF